MASGDNTPKKQFTFIDYTPTSKQLICVLCGDKVIKREYRRRLFNSGNKTEFCLLIEKHLDICIFEDLHTDILCRKCLRDIQKIEHTVTRLKECYNKTIDQLKETHGKQRPLFKRQVDTEDQSSKRRSLFQDSEFHEIEEQQEQGDDADILKVTINTEGKKSEHVIGKDFLPLINSLFSNDVQKIGETFHTFGNIQQVFQSLFLKDIHDEIRTLCSKQSNSVLRQTSKENLATFTWHKVVQEWSEKAPKFKSLLESLVTNPSHQRNKIKKGEAIIGGYVSAGCKLLSIYNQELNALQHIMSLILLKGGCKKSAFTMLSAAYDCLSYPATLTIADKYGKDWSFDLKIWGQEIEEDRRIEKNLLQRISDTEESIVFINGEEARVVDLTFHLSELQEELNQHRSNMHNGFYFVGDNVDMRTKVRHMTISNQNKDQHLYQICAYQNRVSGNNLDDTKPKEDIATVPFSIFTPSERELGEFCNDFTFLVATQWAELVPCFRAYQHVLPKFIQHQYMKEMSMKTVRINMGVLQKNEQYNDQMTDICEFLHKFVPGHDESEDWTATPEQILSGGDYLTFERHKQAQASKRNGRTPSKRLEGLTPKMEEFHNQAELLKVIWMYLYSPASAKDQGTLYAARNTINARNVTKDPSADFYANADFLVKVTKAYIVCGAMFYFGMESLDSYPTKNQYTGTVGDTEEMKAYLMTHAKNFVEAFAIPEVPKIPDYGPQSLTLKCRYCDNVYKKPSALRKHEANLHNHFDPSLEFQQGRGIDSSNSNSTTFRMETADFVLNYTKLSLTLGLIYINQSDAISMGDGDRIMRINQLLYMYYKESSCPKYAHGMLETLAQSKVLLTERKAHQLIWNRTVNHNGLPNSNFPNDLDLEHCNKIFKDEAHIYRGVFTEKTIQRVSRSAQEVHKVVKQFNKMNKVVMPSGKHKEASFENDILLLVQQFSQLNLFKYVPGRSYTAYPQIDENPLRKIDMEKFRDWIASCLKKFQQKHFYNVNKITT